MLPLAATGGHGLPFVGPGTYLIFGIVLVPVYLMVTAWFLGRPRLPRKALLGVGYLAGLVIALWGGMFVATMVIKYVFFL